MKEGVEEVCLQCCVERGYDILGGGDKEGKLEEEREKAVLHREIERVRKPWKIHAGMEKKECCSGKEIVPRRRGKHGVL